MPLHDRIINLPTDKRCPEDMPARLLYKQGHRDARHAAAEMTLEADELMAEMAGALENFESAIHDDCPAHAALIKYYAWKELTK